MGALTHAHVCTCIRAHAALRTVSSCCAWNAISGGGLMLGSRQRGAAARSTLIPADATTPSTLNPARGAEQPKNVLSFAPWLWPNANTRPDRFSPCGVELAPTVATSVSRRHCAASHRNDTSSAYSVASAICVGRTRAQQGAWESGIAGSARAG